MTSPTEISRNVKRLLKEIPAGVTLEAAAKGRTPAEVLAAAEAGVSVIGENYLDEAEEAFSLVGHRVRWHFIGHLQRNKVARVVRLFDMIETVDSLELARQIDRRCARLGRVMPVLVEVNSGREPQKSGVLPEDVEGLVREMCTLPNLKVLGLMTMGPEASTPEELCPSFTLTRQLAERLSALRLPGVEMRYLSMGMSGSYRVAIEEGANIIRIGEGIFGPRSR